MFFYIFRLRKPPGFVGHNPVAGATYSLVFCLFLTMIVTGVAIYSGGAAVGSVLHPFRFLIPLIGGLQTARWIHHVRVGSRGLRPLGRRASMRVMLT